VRARTLIALALLCAACKQPEVRHDEAVKQQLARMRAAIAAFKSDNGRYPRTLDELAPKYLPAIPVDPATKSNKTWRVITEDVVQPSQDFTGSTPKTESYVIDVQSGAAGYSSY
jgi:general secretion pathway protein G